MKTGYLTKEAITSEKNYMKGCKMYKINHFKVDNFVHIRRIRQDELNYHPHNKEGEQMDWVVETRGGSFIMSCTNEELKKYVKINK
jgi:hypothetical protein